MLDTWNSQQWNVCLHLCPYNEVIAILFNCKLCISTIANHVCMCWIACNLNYQYNLWNMALFSFPENNHVSPTYNALNSVPTPVFFHECMHSIYSLIAINISTVIIRQVSLYFKAHSLSFNLILTAHLCKKKATTQSNLIYLIFVEHF